MHLIVEILWKLITWAVAVLFVISLPFIVLALVIFHPHLSPQGEDSFWFFKAMATLFGGIAAGVWWVFFKIAYYIFTERKLAGMWSTVLVVITAYGLEALLLYHGVYSLR
jgi:hypothetical protein